MNALMKLISWTGWTKEDWGNFFYIFTPKHFMSLTGWTEDEWYSFGKGAVWMTCILAFIYVIFLVCTAVAKWA